MLQQITRSAQDSLTLAIEALRDGRDQEAHGFASESWSLRHSREAAALGLLSATSLGDPIQIPRWIRRRRAIRNGPSKSGTGKPE